MKKRLFAIILTVVLAVCSLAPISTSAVSIPGADGGGFDFYSITIHYDEPTVWEFTEVSAADSRKDKLIASYSSTGRISYVKGWVFDTENASDEYELRSGDSLGRKGTAYILYHSTLLSQTGRRGNFAIVNTEDHTSDLYYSTFRSNYSFIHNIHDKDTVQFMDPVSIRGASLIVDDALTPNPNIEFYDDGYAKDINGGRIDYNGYLLDENDNWYTVDANGKKELCSLFRETNAGNLVPVSRFDKDGKVIKVSKYDGAMIYVIDENGEIAVDARGNLRNATPAQGTPVMKTKITKITATIDALGEELYDDVADDPQQKNTITLSLGNTVENINTIPECGTIVGTAKCVTTKTEEKFKKTVSPTTTTVEFEISDEMLESLTPEETKLYLQFGVQEIQGKEAYSSKYTMVNAPEVEKGFKTQDVKLLTSEDISRFVTPSPVPTASPVPFFSVDNLFTGTNLIWTIVVLAAVVLIIVAVIIIIIVASKKKKKNAVAEEAPVEETVVEEVPAEETVAEEAPVEETVVEETPVEEASAEEEKPTEE